MTKRRPLVSGNWKMNLNHFEAIQAVQKLAYRLTAEDHATRDVSVHPPFTDLRSVQTVLESDDIPIALGAQNCHWAESGAYTGEVSPVMLAKLNVAYVIVGHSERRQLFGETDAIVAAKLRAVLAHGMTPILCVGETLVQREAAEAESTVTSQLAAAFSASFEDEPDAAPVPAGRPLAAHQVGQLVIAYEPIWAIGTGQHATPEDAQGMCRTIRESVAEHAGKEVAAALRVQYGGSVTATNAPDLLTQDDIDGALVGGASLDP
ncbi:MAG TPA: triose-phosphate isomerase, partial [Acidimicrobiales bacterium]|nr:triose-phosphate isomerase [Acidimicrobiales bacterium]